MDEATPDGNAPKQRPDDSHPRLGLSFQQMRGWISLATSGSGWKATLTILVLIGSLAVVQRETRNEGGEPYIAILLSGAFLLCGSLGGLIFALPRNARREQPTDRAKSLPASSEAADPTSPAYGANTSLEEISDWLTKIIVGVGLTQLNKIPGKLQQLAAYIGPTFGTTPSCENFALSIILYFTLAGFLFGYLWTRLTLGSALAWADLAADPTRLTKMMAILADKQTDLTAATKVLRDTTEKLDQKLTEHSSAADIQFDHLSQQTSSFTLAVEALREGVPESEVQDALDRMLALKIPGNRTAAILTGRLYKALKKYPEAIGVLSQFLDLHRGEEGNDTADVLYNRACYHALNGERDAALKDVRESLRQSPINALNARDDEDFASLRDDPEFKELIRIRE